MDDSSDDDDFPELGELLYSRPAMASLADQLVRKRSDTIEEVVQEHSQFLLNPFVTPRRRRRAIVYDSQDEDPLEIPDSTESRLSGCHNPQSDGQSEPGVRTKTLDIKGSDPSSISTPKSVQHFPETDLDTDSGFLIALQTLRIESTPPSSLTKAALETLPKGDALPLSYETLNPLPSSDSTYFSCRSDLSCSDDDPGPVNNPASRRPLIRGDRSASTKRARPRVVYSDSETSSQDFSGDGEESDDAHLAILSYSPPPVAAIRPKKILLPVTLPQTPRLDRVQKVRVPRSPYRESNVAFWDEEKSASWIELHTTAPPSSSLLRTITANVSTPVKTPRKTTKELEAARAMRIFAANRESLASEFMNIFIQRVCPGVCELLNGPIAVSWSKTLTSTAGRANYSKSKCTARIELSSKVIDCETRLKSTLAHEMCHILVWVVDKQFSNPHGREFKRFGQKVEYLLGIRVDTTHNYQINYKYQWQCIGPRCAKVYGRHSKSLDPTKVACGLCHGRLIQILPKPRQNNTPAQIDRLGCLATTPTRTPGLGLYQAFLKANIQRIKEQHPATKYADLIKLVAAEYAVHKSEISSVEPETSANGSFSVLTESLSALAL